MVGHLGNRGPLPGLLALAGQPAPALRRVGLLGGAWFCRPRMLAGPGLSRLSSGPNPARGLAQRCRWASFNETPERMALADQIG